MVVLTIHTEKNRETIFFDDNIPQIHFIKLISCSLYNNWDTLKKEGSARLGNIESRDGVSIGKIRPGHYDLESFGKAINKLFSNRGVTLQTEINEPFGQLVIYNTMGKKIELDNDLSNLLGIRQKLAITTFVKQIRSPTAYFIHCDLIDKTQNLFNRRR